jgi:hypothetical protein
MVCGEIETTHPVVTDAWKTTTTRSTLILVTVQFPVKVPVPGWEGEISTCLSLGVMMIVSAGTGFCAITGSARMLTAELRTINPITTRISERLLAMQTHLPVTLRSKVRYITLG